jgi:hypothetical protein
MDSNWKLFGEDQDITTTILLPYSYFLNSHLAAAFLIAQGTFLRATATKIILWELILYFFRN